MKFLDDKKQIPDWILSHLRKYGNCCCGREIVKKIGRERIIEILKDEGYSCVLRIVYENKYKVKRKRKYPVDAYYILEIECAVTSYFIWEI